MYKRKQMLLQKFIVLCRSNQRIDKLLSPVTTPIYE